MSDKEYKFKEGDKVKILTGPFRDYVGEVIEDEDKNEDKYTVAVHYRKNEDVYNFYRSSSLKLISSVEEDEIQEVNFENNLEEENNIKEAEVKDDLKISSKQDDSSIYLTEDYLGFWLSDHNAYYWTQEINESKEVPLYGENGNVIALYNFNKNKLTLIEEKKEKVVDSSDPCDFLSVYFPYNETKKKNSGFILLQKLVTSERLSEEDIIRYVSRNKKKYQLFSIRDFYIQGEKLVVATKDITEKDIFDNYASFFLGAEGHILIDKIDLDNYE